MSSTTTTTTPSTSSVECQNRKTISSTLPPGYKGNLTSKQQEALAEFKQRIREDQFLMDTLLHPQSTRFLLRFLRARNFNLNKSFDMLKNYAQYLDEKKVWDIRIEDVEELFSSPTIKWMGHDKAGRGTFLIEPGLHVPGSMEYSKLGPMLCMVLQLASQELRDERETFTLVFTYKGWGLRNVDSKLDKEMMTVAQNLFPEALGKAFFCSPPWYFSTVWSVCKHFLHQDTREKIEFLSSNPTKTLRENFDDSVLVEALGGTRPDADSIESFLTSRMTRDQTLKEALLAREEELNLEYESENDI